MGMKSINLLPKCVPATSATDEDVSDILRCSSCRKHTVIEYLCQLTRASINSALQRISGEWPGVERRDVDPFAPSLSCVLRLSSRVATKMSVKSGHQPGNGKRTDHIAAPHIAAAAVTKATKRYIRVWRGMSNRYGDPGLSNITTR